MEKKHESKYHFCDKEQDIGSEIKRRSCQNWRGIKFKDRVFYDHTVIRPILRAYLHLFTLYIVSEEELTMYFILCHAVS